MKNYFQYTTFSRLYKENLMRLTEKQLNLSLLLISHIIKSEKSCELSCCYFPLLSLQNNTLIR